MLYTPFQEYSKANELELLNIKKVSRDRSCTAESTTASVGLAQAHPNQ